MEKNMIQQTLKELVLTMARSVVEFPEQVMVHTESGETSVLVTISTVKSDLAFIIGRKGHIINSIRSLAQAAGSKNRKRVIVEVLE